MIIPLCVELTFHHHDICLQGGKHIHHQCVPLPYIVNIYYKDSFQTHILWYEIGNYNTSETISDWTDCLLLIFVEVQDALYILNNCDNSSLKRKAFPSIV